MIIGIGHRSGHGKDTVADFMIERFNLIRPDLSVCKISWASKVKSVCHSLYGHLGLKEAWYYETPAGREERNVRLPRIALTPVEIWVLMGTNAVRNQIWQDTWVETVLAISNDKDIVICPDTRFYNEANACHKTVKVSNPRVPRRQGLSADEILADYDGWDFGILNNSGLDYLRQASFGVADEILRSISAELPAE